MENLLNNIAPILILLLLAVTFLQSGIDKITDWNGNISWLKEHFAKTYIKNFVTVAVVKLLILEIIAGLLCVAGIYMLIANNENSVGLYGAILSCIVLLGLLLGQRIAKDYDGARTIVIYFIPAIFCVYLLAN